MNSDSTSVNRAPSSSEEPAQRDGTAPPVLRVMAKDLGKTYKLYDAPADRLLERLTGRRRHRPHHALEGVSFELRQGETLGVVGQNGAGKSTLLKLLAGVLQPTHGELGVDGTVSSILELGAGFHPDFTGRQNIRINAAMLGLNQRQLEDRLPAIEEFCELGHFLDQPVKVYSSGMSMRLAFAIATQVEPDVLIVDEALSVGDGYFQKKCMDRILELIGGGTSLLFCSHAMYYVSTLCQRVLWLKDGQVAEYGEADQVVRRYEEFLLGQQSAAEEDTSGDEVPAGLVEAREQGPARITEVALCCDGRALEPGEGLGLGQDLRVEVSWLSTQDSLNFQVAIGFDRRDGVQVFGLDTRSANFALSGRRNYAVRFEIEDQPLVRGQYALHVYLLDEAAMHVYDHRILHDAIRIIPSREYEVGVIRVPARVELVDGS